MCDPLVKQEYVEQNDSSNDDDSDDENGIDGIFDIFNDSAKKKLMKEFKRRKHWWKRILRRILMR